MTQLDIPTSYCGFVSILCCYRSLVKKRKAEHTPAGMKTPLNVAPGSGTSRGSCAGTPYDILGEVSQCIKRRRRRAYRRPSLITAV